MLCGNNERKRKWMEACRSYSSITNPLGNTLIELSDKEDIVYADIDISEMITAKQFHDIIGHYTRMDVVSLNLCQDEDRPVWYTTQLKPGPTSEIGSLNLINQVRRFSRTMRT